MLHPVSSLEVLLLIFWLYDFTPGSFHYQLGLHNLLISLYNLLISLFIHPYLSL